MEVRVGVTITTGSEHNADHTKAHKHKYTNTECGTIRSDMNGKPCHYGDN